MSAVSSPRPRAGAILRWIAIHVLCLAAGCAGPPPARPTPALDPALAGAHTIMLGEVHGTNEVPRFVGDLAVSFLAQGKAVTIGLEMPQDLRVDLQDYLASDGGAQARRDLLASTHWSRDPSRQDGRASRAMFELIERVRVLRKWGARIDVAAFDIPTNVRVARDEPQPFALRRERHMADAAAALQRPGETLLLLVGNLHAVKHAAEAPFPAKDKMAALMDDRLPLSIALRYRGGTYWACTREGCGTQQVRLPGYDDASLDGRIVLGRTGGFDGVAYVGPITASEPAIAAMGLGAPH